MKQKIFWIVFLILAVFGPLGYYQINEYVYQQRLEHYDEITHIYQQQSDMLVTDGLLIKSVSNDYSYNTTDLYRFTYKFNDIDFQIRQQYREMMMDCGIAQNKIKYCSTNDSKGAYTFRNQDDTYLIEVYYKDSFGMMYLMSEFIPNQSTTLFKGYVDDTGNIESGELIYYNYSDTIQYYDVRNQEINKYNEFALDGTVDFLYQRYNQEFTAEHAVSVWDDTRNVLFEYARKYDSQELSYHNLRFYNNDDVQLLSIQYDTTNTIKLFWNDDYVDGWNDFYSTNCEDQTPNDIPIAYQGVCANSLLNQQLIIIHLEDYPNTPLNQIFSLEYFGLSFDEVSILQLNETEEYFQNNYSDMEDSYEFDHEMLDASVYQVDMFIQPDETIIDRIR